jgi:hypothetical protein
MALLPVKYWREATAVRASEAVLSLRTWFRCVLEPSRPQLPLVCIAADRPYVMKRPPCGLQMSQGSVASRHFIICVINKPNTGTFYSSVSRLHYSTWNRGITESV